MAVSLVRSGSLGSKGCRRGMRESFGSFGPPTKEIGQKADWASDQLILGCPARLIFDQARRIRAAEILHGPNDGDLGNIGSPLDEPSSVGIRRSFSIQYIRWTSGRAPPMIPKWSTPSSLSAISSQSSRSSASIQRGTPSGITFCRSNRPCSKSRALSGSGDGWGDEAGGSSSFAPTRPPRKSGWRPGFRGSGGEATELVPEDGDEAANAVVLHAQTRRLAARPIRFVVIAGGLLDRPVLGLLHSFR